MRFILVPLDGSGVFYLHDEIDPRLIYYAPTDRDNAKIRKLFAGDCWFIELDKAVLVRIGG
jgi:hypothetical protein